MELPQNCRRWCVAIPPSRSPAGASHPQPMERRSDTSPPPHPPPPAMCWGRWSDGRMGGDYGSEISFPPHHPPISMLLRRHLQATRRVRGPERGPTARHVRAPVPRRFPAMAPRGREQGSKSRLASYLSSMAPWGREQGRKSRLAPCPPSMGQDSRIFSPCPPETPIYLPLHIVNSIGELLAQLDPSDIS